MLASHPPRHVLIGLEMHMHVGPGLMPGLCRRVLIIGRQREKKNEAARGAPTRTRARACAKLETHSNFCFDIRPPFKAHICNSFALLNPFHQRCSRLTYTSLQARAAAQKRRAPRSEFCASSIRSPPLHQERLSSCLSSRKHRCSVRGLQPARDPSSAAQDEPIERRAQRTAQQHDAAQP